MPTLKQILTGLKKSKMPSSGFVPVNIIKKKIGIIYKTDVITALLDLDNSDIIAYNIKITENFDLAFEGIGYIAGTSDYEVKIPYVQSADFQICEMQSDIRWDYDVCPIKISNRIFEGETSIDKIMVSRENLKFLLVGSTEVCFSGAHIDLLTSKYYSDSPEIKNKSRHFTLKIESNDKKPYHNTIIDSHAKTEQMMVPGILVASPCPPIWRPG